MDQFEKAIVLLDSTEILMILFEGFPKFFTTTEEGFELLFWYPTS